MSSTYWNEAEAYHQTAVKAAGRRKVFTSEILYNILSMAIEKYFMEFFERHHTMPDNHTFSDFVNGAAPLKAMDEKLKADLLELERLQQICSAYDSYERRCPTEAEIEKMYDTTNEVKRFCMPAGQPTAE